MIRADEKNAALAELGRHEDHRGMFPFSRLADARDSDRYAQLLAQADSIVEFMAAAFNDVNALSQCCDGSWIRDLNQSVVANALEGAGTLKALAQFVLSATPQENSRGPVVSTDTNQHD